MRSDCKYLSAVSVCRTLRALFIFRISRVSFVSGIFHLRHTYTATRVRFVFAFDKSQKAAQKYVEQHNFTDAHTFTIHIYICKHITECGCKACASILLMLSHCLRAILRFAGTNPGICGLEWIVTACVCIIVPLIAFVLELYFIGLENFFLPFRSTLARFLPLWKVGKWGPFLIRGECVNNPIRTLFAGILDRAEFYVPGHKKVKFPNVISLNEFRPVWEWVRVCVSVNECTSSRPLRRLECVRVACSTCSMLSSIRFFFFANVCACMNSKEECGNVCWRVCECSRMVESRDVERQTGKGGSNRWSNIMLFIVSIPIIDNVVYGLSWECIRDILVFCQPWIEQMNINAFRLIKYPPKTKHYDITSIFRYWSIVVVQHTNTQTHARTLERTIAIASTTVIVRC